MQREFAACDLLTLDEIAAAHEQHAPSILDQGEPDGRRQVAFADAGQAEQQKISALFQSGQSGEEVGDKTHLS